MVNRNIESILMITWSIFRLRNIVGSSTFNILYSQYSLLHVCLCQQLVGTTFRDDVAQTITSTQALEDIVKQIMSGGSIARCM